LEANQGDAMVRHAGLPPSSLSNWAISFHLLSWGTLGQADRLTSFPGECPSAKTGSNAPPARSTALPFLRRIRTRRDSRPWKRYYRLQAPSEMRWHDTALDTWNGTASQRSKYPKRCRAAAFQERSLHSFHEEMTFMRILSGSGPMLLAVGVALTGCNQPASPPKETPQSPAKRGLGATSVETLPASSQVVLTVEGMS
jgi:hypothetical protein